MKLFNNQLAIMEPCVKYAASPRWRYVLLSWNDNNSHTWSWGIWVEYPLKFWFQRGCFFVIGNPSCDWDESFIEVIGNVFENPELLK